MALLFPRDFAKVDVMRLVAMILLFAGLLPAAFADKGYRNLPVEKSKFFRAIQLKVAAKTITKLSADVVIIIDKATYERGRLVAFVGHGRARVWLASDKQVVRMELTPEKTDGFFRVGNTGVWLPTPDVPAGTLEDFFLQTMRSFFFGESDSSYYDENSLHFTRSILLPKQYYIISPKTTAYNFEKVEFRLNIQEEVEVMKALSAGRTRGFEAHLVAKERLKDTPIFWDNVVVPETDLLVSPIPLPKVGGNPKTQDRRTSPRRSQPTQGVHSETSR